MSAPPSDNVFLSQLPLDMTEDKAKEIFGAYGTVTSLRLLQNGSALCRFGSVEEATWIVENLNGNMPQGLDTPIGVKFANPPKAKGEGKGEKGGFSPYGKGGGKDGGYGGFGGFGKGGGKDGGKGKGGKGKGGGIRVLKDGIIAAGVLPGGQWSNDVGALFIGGLPSDTTDLDLYHIFSAFGQIPAKGVRAMMDQTTGMCRGIGFVNFIDPACADIAAQSLNGTTMPGGSTLTVKPKDPPNPDAKGKGKGKDDKGGGKKGGKSFGKGW